MPFGPGGATISNSTALIHPGWELLQDEETLQGSLPGATDDSDESPTATGANSRATPPQSICSQPASFAILA